MKTTLALVFTLIFATTAAFAAHASVSGYYRAEGKEAKLTFARVATSKMYNGDPTIALAFTEKDASDAKDVAVANSVISGEVYTKPDTEMFGAKIEVDLKFKATLPK